MNRKNWGDNDEHDMLCFCNGGEMKMEKAIENVLNIVA